MDVITYHGTPYAFDVFHAPASGIHFGTFDQAGHACSLKLGSMPLAEFEKLPVGPSGWRGRIMLVRLLAKNIKRVKDAKTPAEWRRVIKQAKAQGYDALVYGNTYEGREPADSYVVFDANAVEIVESIYNASQAAA